MKRTAGCTENQDSWPQVNQQHVYMYFFSRVHGNIECIIRNCSKMLFFQFITGWTKGVLYTTLFMVIQKLERSYKPRARKNIYQYYIILMGFNLVQASSTVNLSNLILYQIFPPFDKFTITLMVSSIYID